VRTVDLPTLKTVRAKWALTTAQAGALLAQLPPLARTMVGLAILSGVRRGELFALCWQDIDERQRVRTVREAVYDGSFGTPKTEDAEGSQRLRHIDQQSMRDVAKIAVLRREPRLKEHLVEDSTRMLLARDGGREASKQPSSHPIDAMIGSTIAPTLLSAPRCATEPSPTGTRAASRAESPRPWR
jgi:integrase